MTGSGEEVLFLDLRSGGKAEEIGKMFPPHIYFTAFIDGALVPDKSALMKTLAAAFRFPAYFGHNWDALLDCLRSLPDELPAKGYVLAIKNPGMFLSASPKDLEDFIDTARAAKKFLAEKFKIRFEIVIL